jgi:DNA modification methylase
MSWEIRHGHALASLREMPDESVQMVATSPPYWGLRDYGDSGQAWPAVSYAPMPGLPELTIPASVQPLGLERDPWAYIGHLVEIFREVRRVLRPDGVLFLNLGDSYAGSSQTGGLAPSWGCTLKDITKTHAPKRETPSALKPKDLVGIPWRAAYALQADGWYLRSDCIWAKPNPMPESVRDRPTKAHEYLFILSKSGRYFWDQEAVREAQSPNSHGGSGPNAGWKRSQVQDVTSTTLGQVASVTGTGRNVRTVWTIPTQPYPGAHFAVWPPALAERCIRAGSAVGDVVLDPFSGSGTTGLTAARLGRDYIGLEQSAEYVRLSRQRIADELGIDRATLEQLGDEAPASVQLGMFG